MRHQVLLGVVLLLVVLGAACGPAAAPAPAATLAAAAGPTSPPAFAATSTPDANELRAAVVSGFRAQQMRAIRQRSDTVLKDGSLHRAVVEFVPPDKFHIVADATTELIVISQTVYLKDKGMWTEPPLPAGSLIDLDFLNRLEKSLGDIQLVGTDTLAGQPMQVYQYRSALKVGETEVIGQSKVWISPADHLPYKLIVEGETASLDNRTGKVTGVSATTTIMYEYEPDDPDRRT